MEKSPLRERDAGQKTNRLEPRLKETLAIDGSGSQNLEAAKTGSGTGVHTPEESARFQWLPLNLGPTDLFMFTRFTVPWNSLPMGRVPNLDQTQYLWNFKMDASWKIQPTNRE